MGRDKGRASGLESKARKKRMERKAPTIRSITRTLITYAAAGPGSLRYLVWSQ